MDSKSSIYGKKAKELPKSNVAMNAVALLLSSGKRKYQIAVHSYRAKII